MDVENNTKMTDLEILNHIESALVNQGEKALNYSGECNFFVLKEDVSDQIRMALSDAFYKINLANYMPISDALEEALQKISVMMFNEADPEKVSRCAVGWLIDPLMYSRDFENTSFRSQEIIEAINSKFPDWEIGNDQLEMLMVLQRIHDQYAIGDWPMLFDIVRQHGFEDGFYNLEKDGSKIWEIAAEKGIYTEQ